MSAHDERSASACMQRSAQAKSLPDNGHHLAARLSDSELPMRVILTELPGVTIIEPQIDGHGSLSEPGNQSRNRDARLPSAFVHHNLSDRKSTRLNSSHVRISY